MRGRKIKTCLEEFARGIRSQSSLEDCLEGRARLRFWDTNERSSELLSELPKVTFSRADIDAQLMRFLASEISARELSDWASAIRLLACFVLDEDDPTSSQTWDLLDELMSPDAWGPITVDSVIALRRRLAAVG